MLMELLTRHLSSGFLKSEDFSHDKVISTENPDVGIRINVYYIPEKVVTANCVPVVSSDHVARNGIVHVVEKVLPKPTRTVADIIAADSQFSTLKRMLSEAGLVQTLRDPNRAFTLFAPTDSAFARSQQGGEENTRTRCADSSVKQYVVEHAICSSAVPAHARVTNALGDLLTLSRTSPDGKLYVDDAQLVVRDRVATNGVVHVIDGILHTTQAKTMSEVLMNYRLYKFHSLLESANLANFYDSLENVTFFVPTNEAIQALRPGQMESLSRDNQSLSSVLLYHVMEGQVGFSRKEEFRDSKLDDSPLRLQVHAPYSQTVPQVFVQCAAVVSPRTRLCGGSFHIINRLVVPPRLSIMSLLESMRGFSVMARLLRATGHDVRPTGSHQRTLLAPPDTAFRAMGQLAIARLTSDAQLAEDIINMHLLTNAVCCSQLEREFVSGRSLVQSQGGALLQLSGSPGGALRVGGAALTNCDVPATDGVVHVVDDVVNWSNVFLRI